MKTISTTVLKVNGQFNVYATEKTKITQNYSDLAEELGRDWDLMSKRSKANFRKKQQGNCKEIDTTITVYNVTATVPNIFSEFQLKEAAINHLIHPASGTLFLMCKNGKTGYSTGNFTINK
ncbi:hypothetical protein [Maribacter sp.]|uniref:hypothetical protein n=1 Tax=Maribacter sp. TaxID=1897614 RepID=UPI0025C3B52F|nr:hypothetical protein [Maribacter sp.]